MRAVKAARGSRSPRHHGWSTPTRGHVDGGGDEHESPTFPYPNLRTPTKSLTLQVTQTLPSDDGDDYGDKPIQGFPVLAVDPHKLQVGVVMEVDDNDSYWLHYTTRHDSEKYSRLKEEITQVILQEFHTDPPPQADEGSGGGMGNQKSTSPPGTLAVYDSPSPPRCGAFEVNLLIAEIGSTHVQAILLHSKLNSSRFPSAKNIIHRLHALMGTKMTANTMIESPIKRQYGPIDKHHGLHPCELCGQHEYTVRLPLWDRYNFADSKEHGFRSDTLYHVDLTAHSKQLTRYGVRWVGDCCYSRCAVCGWIYFEEANHEHACLPPTMGWLNGDIQMEEWGNTRFSCRYLPSMAYHPHTRLQPRTPNRRIYIDVVDIRRPNVSYCNAALELVHEATGFRVPVFHVNEDDVVVYAADVIIPSTYSISISQSTYVQQNWLSPFSLDYYSPTLFTVQITFEAMLQVKVVDVHGNPMPSSSPKLFMHPSLDVGMRGALEEVLMEWHEETLTDVDAEILALSTHTRPLTEDEVRLRAIRKNELMRLKRATARRSANSRMKGWWEKVLDVPHIYSIKVDEAGYYQSNQRDAVELSFKTWPESGGALSMDVVMVPYDVRCTVVDRYGCELVGARVTISCEEDTSFTVDSTPLSYSSTEPQDAGVCRLPSVDGKRWRVVCEYEGYSTDMVFVGAVCEGRRGAKTGRQVDASTLEDEGLTLSHADWMHPPGVDVLGEMDLHELNEGDVVWDEDDVDREYSTHPLRLTVVMSKYELIVEVRDSVDRSFTPADARACLIYASESVTSSMGGEYVQPRPSGASSRKQSNGSVMTTMTSKSFPEIKDSTSSSIIPLTLNTGRRETNLFTFAQLREIGGRYAIRAKVPDYRVTSVSVVSGVESEGLSDDEDEVDPARGVVGRIDPQNEEEVYIDLLPTLWSGGVSVAKIQVCVTYCPSPTGLTAIPHSSSPTCKDIDLAIVIDATSSMGRYLAMTRLAVEKLTKEIGRWYPKLSLRLCVIAFTDIEPVRRSHRFKHETPSLPISLLPFTNSLNEVQTFINSIQPAGGTDVPEDLLAGLEVMLRMDWRATQRMAVMITDAPCHGQRFHSLTDDNFPGDVDGHGLKAEELLEGISRRRIKLHCTHISPSTEDMYAMFGSLCPGLTLKHIFINDDSDQSTSQSSNWRVRTCWNHSPFEVTEIADNFTNDLMKSLHDDLTSTLTLSFYLPQHPSKHMSAPPPEMFELSFTHPLVNGGEWVSYGVDSDGEGACTHSLQVPSTDTFAFRARAVVGGGDVRFYTKYSEIKECTIDLTREPEPDPHQSSHKRHRRERRAKDTPSSIKAVTPQIGEYIDGIVFTMTHGKEQFYPSHHGVLGSLATRQIRWSKDKRSRKKEGDSRRSKKHPAALPLGPGEHIQRVYGINTHRHCLCISFDTSSGASAHFCGTEYAGGKPDITSPGESGLYKRVPGYSQEEIRQLAFRGVSASTFFFEASEGMIITGLKHEILDDAAPRVVGVVEEAVVLPETKSNNGASEVSRQKRA